MPSHRQKQLDEQTTREQVDRWNAAHPRGSLVEYQSHPEAPARTVKTTSDAFLWDKPGHLAAVVMTDGRRPVSLDTCRPVEATAAFEFAKALGQEPLTAARARLRDRVPPLVIELDLVRGKMRDLLAIIEHGKPLTEFALHRGTLVRELESLAQQIADLHVSSNPHEE
jgi:hypothetical protein